MNFCNCKGKKKGWKTK